MRNMFVFVACTAVLSAGIADEVRTTDGFVLQGKISAINSDELVIQTEQFGELKVPRATIEKIKTDELASVRLTDDSVIVGGVDAPAPDAVSISGEHVNTTVELKQVQELWPQSGQDPRIVAKQKEIDALQRKWKAEATASAGGKEGNTKEKNLSVSGEAVLEGLQDELKFYGRYSRKETDRRKNTDERLGGAQYTSYLFDPLGWYARTEVENDEFEDIRLRVTVAGGLAYRWANEDHYKLSGRTGLSYRHESYYTSGQDDEGRVGLDFGVSHYYRFKNHWEIKNELTYTPSVEDAKDYLMTQDSTLTMPLAGTEQWNFRVGLRNEYNNAVSPGRDHLDTTWYAAVTVKTK
ncbi:MAG: DUF481 domain-containing protein [Kiritimatiellales bacterium]